MKSNNRSIFRAEAIRRYLQDQHKTVLPQFIRPRMFVYLWILLGFLLLAETFVASLVRIQLLRGETPHLLSSPGPQRVV